MSSPDGRQCHSNIVHVLVLGSRALCFSVGVGGLFWNMGQQSLTARLNAWHCSEQHVNGQDLTPSLVALNMLCESHYFCASKGVKLEGLRA